MVDSAVSQAMARVRERSWFERYGFAVLFVVAQACSVLYISGEQTARLNSIESTQKTMASQMISAEAVNARFSGTDNQLRNVAEAIDKLTYRVQRLEESAMKRSR